ncbi:MAG: hypothetical protein V9G29_05880 [Burkholderiaceae bacterium]
MHALNFHRRRLHRIVWLTLTVWVFAFSSGVVNACLSAPLLGQRSGLVQPISTGTTAHDVHEPAADHRSPAQPDSATTQNPHDRSPASDNCQSFCDDEASALLKSLSSLAELPVLLIGALDRWPPVAQSTLAAARWTHWQTAAQGPPLVIRFLRLTL